MFIAALAALLSGCVDPAAMLEQNVAACEANGYTKGNEEFEWCMIKRETAQAEQAQEQAYNRQAFGAALQDYSARRQETLSRPSYVSPRYPAPEPRRQMNCTSIPLGYYVQTSCY